MKQNQTLMTLWRDANGRELHLTKLANGSWDCVELAKAHADIGRLLDMIADVREPDFNEVMRIANENGFDFGDDGQLVEKSSTER